MVRRLLAARLDVGLFARRAEVLDGFAALGARACTSIAEAVSGAETIISCLFNERQVEEALLGDGGLIEVAKPGAVLVSHTTIGPRLLSQVERAAAARGLSLLDAPVSGAPDDIDAGHLTILAGGEATAMRAMHAVGSLDEFARLGGAYLSKDVAAALSAAGEAGADAGLLARIIHDGPLPVLGG